MQRAFPDGVDHFFSQKARSDGKTIGNLETVDEQISFLSLMDESMGDEQIIETLVELEQIDIRGPEILNAWKKGDEARIADLNLKELKNYPKLYRALFIDHNTKWLQAIEGHLHSPGNAMVDVCFLCLPPCFLAASQHFNHVSVGPDPLRNLVS